MTMAIRREKFRLTCSCGCDEDGTLTMGEAKVLGWTEIMEEQTYEQSIDTENYESILDWYTHSGTCPECTAENEMILFAGGQER